MGFQTPERQSGTTVRGVCCLLGGKTLIPRPGAPARRRAVRRTLLIGFWSGTTPDGTWRAPASGGAVHVVGSWITDKLLYLLQNLRYGTPLTSDLEPLGRETSRLTLSVMSLEIIHL